MTTHQLAAQYKEGYFICPSCSKKDKNKSRLYAHIKSCQMSNGRQKLTEAIRQTDNIQNISFGQIPFETNALTGSNFIEREEFEKLKQQVLKLKNPQKLTNLGPVHSFIRQSVQDILPDLTAIITSQIFKSLKGTSLDFIKGREHALKTNLLSLFSSSNYQTITNDWKQTVEQMERFYLKVIAKKQNHGPSQVGRYRAGFKILSSLNYDEIFHRISMYQKISELSSNARRSFKDAYNFMKKNCSSYNLAVLQAGIVDNRPSMIKKITLNDVKKLLHELLDNKDLTMAADLWATTTMGLRRSELLQVFFSSQGKFFTAIKILQRKNQYETVRIVPKSLAIMIQMSQTPYPMTLDRFCRLRTLCLQRLGRFYGLRHVCITSIVRGLFQMHKVARFHKSSSTTERHYLDFDSTSLIDAAFALESQDDYVDKVNFRQEILKIYGHVTDVQPFNREEIPPFSFQKFQLQNKDEQLIEKNDSQSSKIFHTISRQSTSRHRNMEEFLREQLLSGESIIDNVYEIGELSMDNYCAQLQKCISEKVCVVKDVSDIKESNVSYILVEENSLLGTQMPSMAPASKNYLQNSSLLKLLKTSKCSCCHPVSRMKILHCESCPSFRAICIRSKESNHICSPNGVVQRKKLNIQCLGRFVQGNFISPNFLIQAHEDLPLKIFFEKQVMDRQRINLYEEDFFDDQQFVCQTVPVNFSCRYSTITPHLKEIIRQVERNQLKLPLRISIVNHIKGYGVFAIHRIQKDTVICSYRGQIKTNDTAEQVDDSLWQLGWIGNKNIFICPRRRKNIGRFINSSNIDTEINCVMYVCVSDYRLYLILKAIRQIKSGEQILYSYGPMYWK